MREFSLTIGTAEGEIFDGRVESLNCRALDGGLGVLAGHAPLVTALDPGILRLRQGGDVRLFVVGESLLIVRAEGARILSEYAVEADSPTDAEVQLRELRQWYRDATADVVMA